MTTVRCECDVKEHELGIVALAAIARSMDAQRSYHELHLEAARIYLALAEEGTDERTAQLAQIAETEALIQAKLAEIQIETLAAMEAKHEFNLARSHAHYCEHKGFVPVVGTFEDLPPHLQHIIRDLFQGHVRIGGRVSVIGGMFDRLSDHL